MFNVLADLNWLAFAVATVASIVLAETLDTTGTGDAVTFGLLNALYSVVSAVVSSVTLVAMR